MTMTPAAPRKSLRWRLLAGTLLWIAATLLIAGWGLGNLFQQHIESQFHAELKTHLDQLAAQITINGKNRPELAQPLSDPRFNRPYAGIYWQIDDLDNPAADPLRSRSLWDARLTVPGDRPGDGEIHRHRVAGPEGATLGMIERSIHLASPTEDRPRSFRLIVAADERLMDEPAGQFNRALWLALAVLGSGLLIAAAILVVVGLAPLDTLRVALGKVRNGDSQRLDGAFPAEITPLVEEFNSVLAQNADVIARARTHAGNLAHALKTPLSILSNAAHPRDDEFARLVADQVDTARRQIDYHLTRAQVAASHAPGTRCLVAPVIDGLLRAMRNIHAERPLDLKVRAMPDTLAFRGDTQDLQEMFGNLIDNACKWAAQRVEVHACLEGNRLVVTVDDDGRGIDAEQRDTVIRRGVRADESVPGSGLGLSIVDELAQLYEGGLTLSASPLGGLRTMLDLPGISAKTP